MENKIDFKSLLNTKKREWIPAILKCDCGATWENEISKVEKGKDPYIKAVCRSCNIKRKENLQEQQKIKKLKQLEESLPPRYRGKLKDPINQGLLYSSCSIICGDFGTGKTWESYAVAKKLLLSGAVKSYKLLTEVSLLNDLKDNFDNMAKKLNYYKNLDLLIIDESGKNKDSEFNTSQLFDLLNYRYDWEKKTILVCNTKKKDDLYNLFPTAILDRFRECTIEMNGNSKRYQ